MTQLPVTTMPIKSLASVDRPREKLLARGGDALSNLELVQAVIGSGTAAADVTQIAQDICAVMEAANGAPAVSELMKVRGVGLATATKLSASLKLASRFVLAGRPVVNEQDVLGLLADIRFKKQEHFVAITLDGAQRLISRRVVTVGTLNASLVHPREVFADAITDRAAGLVVAHNHPGGSLEPSGPDIAVTRRLRAAGELLGIKLLDHLIITATSHRAIELD